VDLLDTGINLILALLVLPESQGPSSLVLPKCFNGDCVERVWDICKAVKQEPAAIYALLIDITVREIEREIDRIPSPDCVAVILQSIEQAMALPDDSTAATYLLPLAHAIRRLKVKMCKINVDNLPEMLPTWIERRAVAKRAERICRILESSATSRIIQSSSQLQILCCAQSGTSVQPATSWLAMHVEL
jgi:hypothetical protein